MRSFLTLILILAGTSAVAKDSTYQCKLKTGASNLIRDEVIIGHDAKFTKAFAYDALIAHANSKPIEAKIVENTDAKLTLIWNFQLRNGDGQISNLHFRAALFKKNGKIVMNAKPHGFPNSFSSRGKCSKVDLPGLKAG